jgi:hypothetical protein
MMDKILVVVFDNEGKAYEGSRLVAANGHGRCSPCVDHIKSHSPISKTANRKPNRLSHSGCRLVADAVILPGLSGTGWTTAFQFCLIF